MDRRFGAEIYCGGTYCGNGEFYTEEEALEWARNDGFCDKVIIRDYTAGKKKIVKITPQEV